MADSAKSAQKRADMIGNLVERIKNGTAPWQKPWKPGEIYTEPFNPVSKKPYRGINHFVLSAAGREDSRWLTYKQAQTLGAQVRRGEKAQSIMVWRFPDEKNREEEDGKERERTKPAFPFCQYFSVFNAEQIDGLPPLPEPPAPAFEACEEAEKLLASVGVPLLNDQGNRAFYRPGSDSIHMPQRASFATAHEYYATALHEAAHATGHHSRLARDLSGGFGSPSYAREELRAEMASFVLTTRLGLGHYPERHASYLNSWVKALNEEPNILFQAARDVGRIETWICEEEKRLELRAEVEKAQGRKHIPAPSLSLEQNSQRHYLYVPFEEKNEAKTRGAQYDREVKSWYAPPGADLSLFAAWEHPRTEIVHGQDIDPVQEFTGFCESHGLILKEPPKMDGRFHRVPVMGDSGGEESGSYRAFLSGRPAGTVTNFKAGGTHKWVSERTSQLSKSEQATRLARTLQQQKAKDQHKQAMYEEAAQKAVSLWAKAETTGVETHPYLIKKGVQSHSLRTDHHNNLLVPLCDRNGQIRNLQRIAPEGNKFFLEDGQVNGLMFRFNGYSHSNTVILAEGFATAASLNELTGHNVFACFQASNLLKVAEQFAEERHAGRNGMRFVVAADDDWKNPLKNPPVENVGIKYGQLAANALNCPMIRPPLEAKDKERTFTDFNDLHKAYGRDVCRKMFADLGITPIEGRTRAPSLLQAVG